MTHGYHQTPSRSSAGCPEEIAPDEALLKLIGELQRK
jgi:hypothetical protein